MEQLNRRLFLSQLSASFAALPFVKAGAKPADALTGKGCWLTVCVPLVVEDAARNIHTDIVLTAASFSGVTGYQDVAQATEYELSLYDAAGKPLKLDGSKDFLRLKVAAMHATLLRCSELVRGRDAFWGGMRIRCFVSAKESNAAMPHIGDLFSAAFVRWNHANSFDTLHAHPDPPQLQIADRFYSSMPYPDLDAYDCTLAVFNPYEAPSEGRIVLYGEDGGKRLEQPYRLPPFGSTRLSLGGSLAARGATRGEARTAESVATGKAQVAKVAMRSGKGERESGSVLIENHEKSAKNFAYLMIKGKADNAFAAEHTIHQGNYPVAKGYAPFDERQAFKARGWVFSSFIFKKTVIGGLELSSRVYFSAGRPLEDELWLLAYTNDAEGNLQWATSKDEDLNLWLPPNFLQRGAIRLRPFQSCSFDFDDLGLAAGFAGGIGVATSPQTSHVLMKVEVKVHNWGTTAFSHFRPGVKSGYRLKGIAARGGLASDYIVTGAQVKQANAAAQMDSLLAVYNLEDSKVASPTLEVFGRGGFLARKSLGQLPEAACRHYLLSALFPELAKRQTEPLTVRLMDENAVVTLGALHIDYQRRDIALDHGSDRFSTYLDHGCD